MLLQVGWREAREQASFELPGLAGFVQQCEGLEFADGAWHHVHNLPGHAQLTDRGLARDQEGERKGQGECGYELFWQSRLGQSDLYRELVGVSK